MQQEIAKAIAKNETRVSRDVAFDIKSLLNAALTGGGREGIGYGDCRSETGNETQSRASYLHASPRSHTASASQRLNPNCRLNWKTTVRSGQNQR
jgi:hypothetical protein